jgi:hypothetical protein
LPPHSTGSVVTLTDDTVSERWCSEDLSALVLFIERTEPDPELFQVPPNYTITETTEGPSAHTNIN